MYATIEQARAAGATGTDAQVLDALAVARTLIDRFTGRWYEPTTATVVARVGRDGLVLLPYVVRSVTAVRDAERGTLYPVSSYTVSSSDRPGDFDAVRLGSRSWADPLIVGAEPWNGGWANLVGSTSRVEVEGSFGHAVVPPVVADAAAALAAWRTGGGSLIPTTSGGDGTPPTTDDEGNAVSITIDATQPITTTRTTGVAAVDAALQSLHTQHVLIG